MARFSIEAVFEGIDKITAPINRIDNRLGRFTRTTRSRLRQIDRVSNDLAASLGRVALTAGKAIAGSGALAAGSITLLNQATVRADTLAKSVDVSVNTAEALGAAVSGAGFDFETIVDLVEEMNNKLGESAGLEQITPVTESLAILGLEFKNIQNLKPEDQFKAIANAALAMEDGQKAAAAADILLGGEANRVIGILRDQGGTIEEVIARYESLNFLTDRARAGAKQYSAQLGFTTQAVSTISRQFSGLAGEALAPVLEKFNALLVANRELIQLKIQQTVTAIADAFDWLVENIDSVVTWFNRLVIAVVTIKAITTALRILNTAVVVFAYLETIIPVVIGLFGSLRKVMLGFALAAALNPVILGVVAAVAVLAGVAFVVIRNWDTVSAFFSSMWQVVTGLFSAGVSAVSGVVDGTAAVFMKGWDTVSAFFSSMWQVVTGLFSAGVSAVSGVVDGTAAVFMKGWEPVSAFFSDMWATITESFTSGVDNVVALLDKIPNLSELLSGAARLVGLGDDDEAQVVPPQERAAQLTQERIENTSRVDMTVSVDSGLSVDMKQPKSIPGINLALLQTGDL